MAGDIAEDVARLAATRGVKLVLIGAHAANLYTGKPRSSKDVDFIADKPEALGELEGLKRELHDDVVRYVDENGHEVIDLLRPHPPLFKHVLSTTTQHGPFFVPSLEMMLGLKFFAMVNPRREWEDRNQDALDFTRIVRHNKTSLDRKAVAAIGELVYAGGADEMLGYVDDALAGRQIIL
ncbi:MAG: hypothetical protein L6Q71_05810 [Planctomycetes bacterium]|nr:hypothetical protein [Planctomycetota bacterium]